MKKWGNFFRKIIFLFIAFCNLLFAWTFSVVFVFCCFFLFSYIIPQMLIAHESFSFNDRPRTKKKKKRRWCGWQADQPAKLFCNLQNTAVWRVSFGNCNASGGNISISLKYWLRFWFGFNFMTSIFICSLSIILLNWFHSLKCGISFRFDVVLALDSYSFSFLLMFVLRSFVTLLWCYRLFIMFFHVIEYYCHVCTCLSWKSYWKCMCACMQKAFSPTPSAIHLTVLFCACQFSFIVNMTCYCCCSRVIFFVPSFIYLFSKARFFSTLRLMPLKYFYNTKKIYLSLFQVVYS